jgi:pimeloyl-ACP methyl ester carboxylesterase
MGGTEPRLGGRLEPSEMFPAGHPAISARLVTLASGVRIRLAESGSGERSILLVHGWGASMYMWREWFEPLASAGYRVLAIDLPGHGLSDKPDESRAYRLESLSAMVREVIDLERLSTINVVAQSMGGSIMLEVARGDDRIRNLALVNPACFGKVRHEKLLRLASVSWFDALLPRLVGRWVVSRTHRMVFGDPSGITARDEDETWAPSQFPSYARAMRRLLREFPWTRAAPQAMIERISRLPARLLVLLGTRDRLVLDAERYVRCLQEGGASLDLAIIEGGGHALNEERPRELAERVLAFFTQDHR